MEKQPLSQFQILITHKHLYSENISVESSVLLKIDFLCVCVSDEKRSFQCDQSCNGLPKHMCLCVSCPNHLMGLEAIFLWVHQKWHIHFYLLLTFGNVTKSAFQMVIILCGIKHVWCTILLCFRVCISSRCSFIFSCLMHVKIGLCDHIVNSV